MKETKSNKVDLVSQFQVGYPINLSLPARDFSSWAGLSQYIVSCPLSLPFWIFNFFKVFSCRRVRNSSLGNRRQGMIQLLHCVLLHEAYGGNEGHHGIHHVSTIVWEREIKSALHVHILFDQYGRVDKGQPLLYHLSIFRTTLEARVTKFVFQGLFTPNQECLFAQTKHSVTTGQGPRVKCILHFQHQGWKNNFSLYGQKKINPSFNKKASCCNLLGCRYLPQYLSLLVNVLEAESNFQKSLAGWKVYKVTSFCSVWGNP